jgi:hypothetical protein
VGVNAILPGAVETNMYNPMNDTADKQPFMTKLRELVTENFQHPLPPMRPRQRSDQRSLRLLSTYPRRHSGTVGTR